KGGSEYVVAGVEDTSSQIAIDTVSEVVPDQTPEVTQQGDNNVRVQLGTLDTATSRELRDALADAYGVDAEDDLTVQTIGPSWGSNVSSKALQSLVLFLVLVSVVMAFYFRAWRMAVAALVALGHDLLFTV